MITSTKKRYSSYSLLKMIKEFFGSSVREQKTNKFMGCWHLDDTVLLNGRIEFVVENTTMLLPSRSISH